MMENGKNIKEIVKRKYAQAITSQTGCCGGSGCCPAPGKTKDIITRDLYNPADTEDLPPDITAASFGCGNPVALAELKEGETVLDLGSGAGLDVLLSAKRVGPGGKAYGLEMTEEMLVAAKANRERAGIDNAEFLQGHIEDIPLQDNSIDVIISNCVINLSADKDKVLKECFRVLKPGGRLAVADVVLKKPLPEKVRQDIAAWTSCIAGALLEQDYHQKLAGAGFEDIEIEFTRIYDLSSPEGAGLLPGLDDNERHELSGTIASAFIRARKPILK